MRNRRSATQRFRAHPARQQHLIGRALNRSSPDYSKVFAPAEARRLLDKLDLQYTPTHGSWLNMAEIEFSVFSRQCLTGRIGDCSTFQSVATRWSNERNRSGATVIWQFTSDDARIKLKSLYPVIQS